MCTLAASHNVLTRALISSEVDEKRLVEAMNNALEIDLASSSIKFCATSIVKQRAHIETLLLMTNKRRVGVVLVQHVIT
jgi:hypothetical protein